MAPGDRRSEDLFNKFFGRGSNLDPAEAVFQERFNDLFRGGGYVKTASGEIEHDAHRQRMFVEEQIAGLERLTEEWAKYTETRKSLTGQSSQDAEELWAYNRQLEEQLRLLQVTRKEAQEQQKLANAQRLRGAGLHAPASGAPTHGILPPNTTQEQLRRPSADRDYDPARMDNRGLNLRESLDAFIQGDLSLQALALQPLSQLKNRAKGREVVDPASGAAFRRPDALSRGIKYGGGAAAALYGASTAIPFALQRTQGFYNQIAGQDVAAGLSAGFSGNQGVSAGATGLANRFLFLPQALGALPIFGSEAQQYGVQRRIEAFKAGINPFDALSIGQAEGIQDEVKNRGYVPGSSRSKDVTQALFRLANNSGIDSGQALDYIDVLVKRLGVSVEEAEKDLMSFGKSAQAAGKSVDTFTKEVTALVEAQVSQGTNVNRARAIASTFASISGVPGEALSGAVSAQNPLLLQELLRNNPSALSTPGDVLGFLANPQGALGASGSADVLVQTIDRALNFVRNIPGNEGRSNAELIDQAKEIGLLPGFEQLDADQIAKIYEQKEAFQASGDRSEALEELETGLNEVKASGRGPRGAIIDGKKLPGTKDLADVLKETPELKSLYDRYFASIENNPEIDLEERERIRKALYEEGKSPQQVEELVNEAIVDGKTERVQSSVTLDATPELKRLIRVLDSKNGQVTGSQLRSPSERNSSNDNRDSTLDYFKSLGP